MPVYSRITRPKSARVLRNRGGFTIIEAMTAVSMAVLMTAMSLPKLKETRRAASMQSAKAHVQSYLSVARAMAIRSGARTILVRSGNSLKIVVDSATTTAVVVRPMALDTVSNVTLSSSNGTSADTIIFDPRGFASLPEMRKFYITASGYGAGTRDSLCVTRLGFVLGRTCGAPAAGGK